MEERKSIIDNLQKEFTQTYFDRIDRLDTYLNTVRIGMNGNVYADITDSEFDNIIKYGFDVFIMDLFLYCTDILTTCMTVSEKSNSEIKSFAYIAKDILEDGITKKMYPLFANDAIIWKDIIKDINIGAAISCDGYCGLLAIAKFAYETIIKNESMENAITCTPIVKQLIAFCVFNHADMNTIVVAAKAIDMSITNEEALNAGVAAKLYRMTSAIPSNSGYYNPNTQDYIMSPMAQQYPNYGSPITWLNTNTAPQMYNPMSYVGCCQPMTNQHYMASAEQQCSNDHCSCHHDHYADEAYDD